MSSPEEIEAKTGHPPALKVGGMRVAQHSNKRMEEPQTSNKQQSKDDDYEYVAPKSPPKPPLVISGAVARADRDFPIAAVIHTHQKPVPTHNVHSHTKPVVIHQPKK
ncbi:hypothetical protein Pcinc_019663 [Petrolisthes cinctipes]|uniref:Death-associated protein 1 n=1 Tax=Petrolisthes cinctipes TaxID=88211 RepID=A0AAE1KHF0_PETCI|nr:hypothetical protein Pcinc_019663 [Petrolisthes cinctipes]